MQRFDKRQWMTFGLIAVVAFFASTLTYAPSCGDIGCSPDFTLGKFYFSTTTLVLLGLQVVGIIVLVVALIFSKKREHQTDAFASLARNSTLFSLQPVQQQS